jgi:hypothetical protein
MNLIDRVSAVLVVVFGFTGAAWWFGHWIPEHDKFLWAVHDCYMEAGCGDRIQNNAEHEECWSTCASRVKGER